MEALNTNFKVIGLTRLGIKPESTAPEVDALSTRSSELLTRPSELINFCKYDDRVAMSCVRVPSNDCQSSAECMMARSSA